MSVLVGGGTGFVGRHLTKMLIDHGFKVTIVSRTSKPNQITWKDVERNGLPENCTAVVNVAGENILNAMKRFSNKAYRDEIWKSRIDTTRCLAKAIRDAEKPPEVFVTMSGVGFYPPSTTAEYTESSPGGDDWLAELAREWELAGVLPQKLSTRRVIVRSGIILGKDGGLMMMFRPTWFKRKKIFPCFDKGMHFFPWIHVKDMAGIIKFAIDNPRANGLLNAVSPVVAYQLSLSTMFASMVEKAKVESVILGKDGGMIKEVSPFFKNMLGARLGSGKQYFPWIHVKDVAGIMTYAVKNSNVTGILNGVAPEVATNRHFTEIYAAAWKRSAFVALPEFYIKLIFGKERAKVVLEGQRVIPKRTLRLGYSFYYPTLVRACKELVS